MKFTVSKESIQEDLQLLQGIVEKRNTMPILANILLDATPGKVELMGTDLEVGLKTYFEAEVEKPGTITVSGKKLFEIVRSLSSNHPVTFKGNDDLLMEITSGKSEFKVLCLPREDFPQLPESKFEKGIVLPLEKIRKMIDHVYCSIAQEQRYYLSGALMILRKNILELVSTDGHRLSYTSTPLDGPAQEEDIRVIVAKKTLNELRRIVGENLEFDCDENNLFFRAKNRTLISRVIESKFPNFEAVIPKNNPHRLIVQREDFADAVRRVALLSTERSRGIKFYIQKNQLKLFSSNPEIGEARDQLDVDYKGEELEIGFNSLYLLDFLSSVESEKIRLDLKDDNSAALMSPEADGAVKYSYVLMPMKL